MGPQCRMEPLVFQSPTPRLGPARPGGAFRVGVDDVAVLQARWLVARALCGMARGSDFAQCLGRPLQSIKKAPTPEHRGLFEPWGNRLTNHQSFPTVFR